MEDPKAPGKPGPVLQDSVVGGDLHTGNIIHNHYHVTQTTTAVSPSPAGATEQIAAGPQRRPAIYVNPSGNPLGTEDRNLVLAYVFCICLGYLGAHRFYLGHIGMGVLYIFTFGFFGLGWFIDLFILPDMVHVRNRRSPPS
ncbi:MAG: TM2 domain-containing protein [Candidatus Poseidoniales archaeon]